MASAVLILASCASPKVPPSPAGGGSFEGVILFHGEVPEPTRVENATDPEVCGRAHVVEDLLVSERGGVQDAIVALLDVPEQAIPPVVPGRLVLDNHGCRFSPRAAVLVAGGTLEAANSDPVLHTTHLYGPAEVNIALPAKGARSERRLDKQGLYAVRCDVHGWMQAVVRVDEHPFHAVSGANGAFRIDGIPAGRYRVEVWHERLGTREAAVGIEDGNTTRLSFEYDTGKPSGIP